MQKAIIGKKIGMTQIFDEKGNVVPVTVVEAGPCPVTQKKTLENDGYESVQLGFQDVKVERLTKPLKGHFAKANAPFKKHLKEFRLEESTLKVGDEVVTIGGILGKVVSVKDETVVLETGADRNKIRFTKAAIATNASANARAQADKEAKEAAKAKEKAAKKEGKKKD